ncbi:hypothetical protein ACH3O9_07475 [Leeuwenhoekiella sp. A16]|uniref:hypothetical protein n=1 Tax=unclassified Leeuwenhoekiella TaxID=2615029 RepID=UPI003A813AF6|tara:strand:- start:2070 stop:2717 length:648 start_codon:yes stop_codon:yes gene_type:complete
MSSYNKYNKKEVKQRWNFAFALFIVFGLVLTTNLLDRKHFNTAQDALTTVYEDRVVAQHYLYNMNTIIHQKEEQFLQKKVRESLEQDVILEELVEKYAATKLTLDERREFATLQQHLATLRKIEFKLRKKPSIENQNIPAIFKEIKKDLNILADIQMSESENRTKIAQKSLNTNQLLSHMEFGLLLIIGVLLQLVIFYRVKNTPKINARMGLRVE